MQVARGMRGRTVTVRTVTLSEDSGSEDSDSEDSNSEEAGTGVTLAEICGRGSKRALDVAA